MKMNSFYFLTFIITSIICSSQISNFENEIRVNWTKPIILNDENQTIYFYVGSVYHDPISNLIHVLYINENKEYYCHYAISAENNEIIYKTQFKVEHMAVSGVISGPKDGKNVYLVYRGFEDYLRSIYLCESEDSGKSWKMTRLVSKIDARFSDMIYISKTGRIFIVFYNDETKEIQIITRAAGSSIFSQPKTVVRDAEEFIHGAKLAYSYDGNNGILHLFYITKSEHRLGYIKSTDNGITWTEPKIMGPNRISVLTNIAINQELTDRIFIAYALDTWVAYQMIYTEDHGENFSNPIEITDKKSFSSHNIHGFAISGTQEKPLLVCLFNTIDMYSEFNVWDIKRMDRIEANSPFPKPDILNESIDVKYDYENNKICVYAFATIQAPFGNQLIYSKGYFN